MVGETVRPQSAIHEIFVLLDSVQEQLQQIRARAKELLHEEEGEQTSDEP